MKVNINSLSTSIEADDEDTVLQLKESRVDLCVQLNLLHHTEKERFSLRCHGNGIGQDLMAMMMVSLVINATDEELINKLTVEVDNSSDKSRGVPLILANYAKEMREKEGTVLLIAGAAVATKGAVKSVLHALEERSKEYLNSDSLNSIEEERLLSDLEGRGDHLNTSEYRLRDLLRIRVSERKTLKRAIDLIKALIR